MTCSSIFATVTKLVISAVVLVSFLTFVGVLVVLGVEWWNVSSEHSAFQQQCLTQPELVDRAQWQKDDNQLRAFSKSLLVPGCDSEDTSIDWSPIQSTQLNSVLHRFACDPALDFYSYKFIRSVAIECYQNLSIESCVTLATLDAFHFTQYPCLIWARMFARYILVSAEVIVSDWQVERGYYFEYRFARFSHEYNFHVDRLQCDGISWEVDNFFEAAAMRLF